MDRTSRVSIIDERLLETLARAFAQHAGDAPRIDAARLKKALGLRDEYLANRMLALFDRDGDGTIDRDEFMSGVRAIVFGTDEQKLRFAFRLHDHDDDGSIDASELRRMITIGLAEDDVSTADGQIDRLGALLLREADRDGDGRLSFAEFDAAIRRHPALLEQMTRSEARWIAPNEDLLARAEQPRAGLRERLSQLISNRGGSVVFVTLWALVNVAIVVSAMTKHTQHMRAVPAGPSWLAHFGNACTSCIQINVALLFLPVMRRLVTRLRESRFGRSAVIDDAIDLHRLVGVAILLFAIGHAAARLVSYTAPGRSTFTQHLLSLEALTGGGILVATAVMWFFARKAIRRTRRFELFYFTHLLYVPWIVLAAVHAPAILLWGGVALVGFVAEQVLRLRRRARATNLIDARALRSGVTRLELARPEGFVHRAGDYLFLCVPDVARHEWHPFTISSAPEAPALTVHVRALGNWTSALRRAVEERADGAASLVAHVDGPYGSPAGHVYDATNVVLIAAGIGVTPFASILESISIRARRARAAGGAEKDRLAKVHFFWLNHDQYSFEWFTALLADLEAHDASGQIDLHVYMTGGHGGLSAAGLEVARELARTEGTPDLVTGLSAKTHSGHPNWARVLGDIAKTHAPSAVPVFFCGPPGLARKLAPICAGLAMPFREERF